MEAMIEEEERGGHGDPDREAKLWHGKLREADTMRSVYQDLAAKGLLTYEELGDKLSALEEDAGHGAAGAASSDGMEEPKGGFAARQGRGAGGLR